MRALTALLATALCTLPAALASAQVEPPEGTAESPDFPALTLLAIVVVVVVALVVFLLRMRRKSDRTPRR